LGGAQAEAIVTRAHACRELQQTQPPTQKTTERQRWGQLIGDCPANGRGLIALI